MKFADWTGEAELAIGIWSTAVISKPPQFAFERTLLADVGLHALARRYERGAGRDDDAVLRDLAVLSHASKGAIDKGGEFAIPAGEGKWIGSVTTVKGSPALGVRTFMTP